MKIQYFADTDTLLFTSNERPAAETRDLDDDTLLDVDAEGRIVSITLEHARERADVDKRDDFSTNAVAANKGLICK